MDTAIPSSRRVGATAIADVLRRPWRYVAGPGRDLRLDFLRGWCLFSMVVDHAAAQRDSFLFRVTGNSGLPMTGAHGFVLISGVTMGIIYGRLIAAEGYNAGLWKALRRALKLYALAIGLGVFGLLFAMTPWGGGTQLSEYNLDTAVRLLTLRANADDLLAAYAVFVLAAPLAFWAFQRGGTSLVLGASVLLWLSHLAAPSLLNLPFQVFIPIAEWQLLFVVGLAAGYHREAIAEWLTGARRTVYLALLFGSLALLAALHWAVSSDHVDERLGWVVDQVYSDYDRNPPLHMWAVLTYLLSIYHLAGWMWKPLGAAFGWFLMPLGQAALYVYAMHIVLVFYLLPLVPGFGSLQGLALAAALLGLMILLWAMVKGRFLFGLVPR